MAETGRELIKWPITDKQLADWKPLDIECPRDRTFGCVFNVLAFVGVLPHETAEQMTRLVNRAVHGSKGSEESKVFRQGTSESEFRAVMHGTFLKKNEDHTIELRNYEFPDWEKVIRQYSLNNNEGTFLWLQRAPYRTETRANMTRATLGHLSPPKIPVDVPLPNHAVVLARNQYGKLVIVDPQQTTIHPLEEFVRLQFRDPHLTERENRFRYIGGKFLFKIEKPNHKRAHHETLRFFHKTKSPNQPATKKRRLTKPKFDLPLLTRAEVKRCAETPLQPDEVAILLISHGRYVYPTDTAQMDTMPFSTHPVFPDGPDTNKSAPSSDLFSVPENMVLYQYAKPENTLTIGHLKYLATHIGSGKCIVQDLPNTIEIYEKRKPRSRSKSKSRTKKNKEMLYCFSDPHTTHGGDQTNDLILVFDHSVNDAELGRIRMGYLEYTHDSKDPPMRELPLTYTCLKNVLYDLSLQYAGKKVYVHQFSCRTGDYSAALQPWKTKQVPISPAIRSLGSKHPEKMVPVEASVYELARALNGLNISESARRKKFTQDMHQEMLAKGYIRTGYIYET